MPQNPRENRIVQKFPHSINARTLHTPTPSPQLSDSCSFKPVMAKYEHSIDLFNAIQQLKLVFLTSYVSLSERNDLFRMLQNTSTVVAAEYNYITVSLDYPAE